MQLIPLEAACSDHECYVIKARAASAILIILPCVR